MKQVAASPLKVLGGMLTFFREKAGFTPEELGGRAYLSGSLIRKIEAGTRAPSESLVTICEAMPEMGCHGAGLTLAFTLAAWATFTASLRR